MAAKLFKNTLLYAIGEILPRAISFILLPIFTAVLTTEAYGVLSYTSAFSMFFYVLSSLCLNSYLLRHYFECKTESEKKKLIGNIFLFIGGLNIILMGLLFFLLPSAIEYFSIKVPWNPYFRLAVICNFFEVFTIVPMVLYRVREQAVYFVFLSVFRVLLQFSLVYYFVVVEFSGVIGSYYGQLIALVLYFFISWGIILKNAVLNINISQIRAGLRFSLPLLPGALAYLIMSLSDRIILERHVTLAALGVYNVAVTFSQALNVVVQSAYRALEPEIFRRFNTDGFTQFINKASTIYLALVYILAIGLALFSQEVFYFFTSESFYSGSGVIPYVIFGILFAAHNVVFGSVLAAENNTKSIGISMLVGGGVSIVINICLIPILGVYASALASGVAFLVMDVLLFLRIKTMLSLKSGLLNMAVYIVLVIALEVWHPTFSIWTIVIKLIIYGCLCLVLCKLNNINKSNLKSVI